jgi:hypothetical protein
VPMDRLAHATLDYYAVALDRLAVFARTMNHPTEAAQIEALTVQVRTALGLAQP